MKRVYWFVVGIWLSTTVAAPAAPPVLRGIGVDEALDGESVLASALDRARLGSTDVPTFVRLLVRQVDLREAPGFTRLDARLDLYARRNVPVVLTLVDPPVDVPAIDAWQLTLRALAQHARRRVLAFQVGDRLEAAARPDPKAYAYLVKFVAVQVRAIDPGALVIEGSLTSPGASEWQEQVYKEEVAAYVDGLAVTGATDNDQGQTEAAFVALDHLAAREDPSSLLGVTTVSLPGDARRAADLLIGWYLTHLGGRATFITCTADLDTLASVLKAAATVKDVFTGEIVTLDERAADLRLTVGGQDVTAKLPHRLLYNISTFATYLVYWAPGQFAGQPLQVSLHLASAGTPVVRDAVAGTMVRLSGGETTRNEAAKTSTARVEPSERPLLLDFNFGAEEVFAMRSGTTERALPTVDEIIFRYQQAETAQDALVHNYVAHAHISVHFQPTTLDSYDVVTENQFFSDSESAEWVERSFSINGAKWGRKRPPFPLLQPEKVLSLPLALRFNRDYVYHLEGVENVAGRACYVVHFDPVDQSRSLYRGKVWIDTERYVRLKVQAVQTALTAPVVSNEEVQTYEPVGRVEERPVYLFSKLVSRQIMLIAGRNLLVERDVTFSDFRINDPAFQSERQQARQSDDIMYRDTDKGLRYFVKRGNERVVSDQLTTTGKALALGATFDPSYDYPIPLFGIDYANFNWLNRGLQLGFIFAGVLGAGNVQKANIAGTRLDVSVDVFGIAVYADDQVYDEQGEREAERLRSRKALTGINFGYQVSDFQKFTLGAHVEYNGFSAAPGYTDPTFVPPSDTAVFNPSLAYEYRRGGYSLLAAYNYFQRSTWRPWGNVEDFDPATRTYTKYNVGLSKDIYFRTFSKIRFNAAYYGGQREDRLSMYRFGLFDETRMRGVPTAGVRFSELGMVRASYSFNALNLYRFAFYLDHAHGRTPTESTWVGTTGIGVEVNFPGPKITMWKLGIGKGFLPEMYKGSGSLVVELLVLKPI